MNNIELLDAEIKQLDAKEVSAHPEWDEIQARLAQHLIRSDSDLPNQKFLIEIDGVKCFPRGDLVAISGKEKCGKTTVCRILSAILLRGEYEGYRALENNLRILWIDTEQAKTSTRTVCRGIDLMCGFNATDDQIRFLNLREWGDKETMRLVLQVMFDSFRPDFVILDGIRDFIHDFNDVCESAEIVLDVMRLSSGVSAEQGREQKLHERQPCCIACILHQNKPKDDKNLRGHLGTELANKAGEVWESTRGDDGLFKFTQTRSRTRPVEIPLAFKVHSRPYIDNRGCQEDIGIPEMWRITSSGEQMPMESQGPVITTSMGIYPKDENTALWLFWRLMNGRGWKYDDLKRQFCTQYGVPYQVFNELKAMVASSVVKDDLDLLWHYQGPSFAENE